MTTLSDKEIEEGFYNGYCEANCPHHCIVELDGTCEHGNDSMFIVLGLV